MYKQFNIAKYSNQKDARHTTTPSPTHTALHLTQVFSNRFPAWDWGPPFGEITYWTHTPNPSFPLFFFSHPSFHNYALLVSMVFFLVFFWCQDATVYLWGEHTAIRAVMCAADQTGRTGTSGRGGSKLVSHGPSTRRKRETGY